jgi:hypothetical protein
MRDDRPEQPDEGPGQREDRPTEAGRLRRFAARLMRRDRGGAHDASTWFDDVEPDDLAG